MLLKSYIYINGRDRVMKQTNKLFVWGLLGATILLQALTLILFKQAAITLETFSFMAIITNVFYLVSFSLFFVRSVIWQLVLKHLPLSIAYPAVSLNMVLLLIFGYLLFGETISWNNILGTAVMLMGVILMNTSKETHA